jgi:hypothetical protein
MQTKPFTRTTWCVGTLAAVLALSACAPVRVSSYAVPKADLTAYRTYAWQPGELGLTGDARLDNNSFFRERVQQAADSQLGFRGYQKLATGTPDMLVHIHARVEQRLDSSQIDRDGACEPDECRPYVYDEGTLLLDLVDARTNTLIWRGWAERSLDGVIDNQEWLNQAIDRAVSSIFGRLPVRRL